MKGSNTRRLPLEGVRIADFTWAWAGPYATMLLALMGAEVIKIETHKRPDHSRLRSLASGPVAWDPDKSPIFNDLNLNKMSITLDLAHPKAVELAKRLVAISDVVAENFRPGVMDRLGLGYDVLKDIKPDIVMLSSSSLGAKGPESKYAGYAPIFAAHGGLAHLTGYPDKRPVPLMGSSDLRSAATSAFAILIALYHRGVTSEGQHIDLSSVETLAVLIGDAFLDYFMNNRVPVRKGNRDDIMAPHNSYRCKGENQWVSIAVATDEEWQSLCEVMGNPAWANDERFSDVYRRWHNQEELDGLIGEWTSDYTPGEVTEMLQQASVAAFPSFDGTELFHDPHLQARGLEMEITHPAFGKRKVLSPLWKFSETSAEVSRHGPCIGEHNEYVLSDLLGIPQHEIDKLTEEGVLY
jgi:benzylsuccinate CoA-transferase BbsF subunit